MQSISRTSPVHRIAHPVVRRLAFAGAVAAVIAGPRVVGAQGVAPTGGATATSEAARALGVDTTSFDRSVRPQDDFYRFVNGGWLARTAMPADASIWSTWMELREESRRALHEILEDAARRPAERGSTRRKVGDFYASFMDSARVESLGLAPLRRELATIAAIRSGGELPVAFARFARIGVRSPIELYFGPDFGNSRAHVLYLEQSGLGLPDRDYYLLQDAKTVAARRAYRDYASRLLSLAGQPDADGAAARILSLETALAERQWTRARNRDWGQTYNRMSRARLGALLPHVRVDAYLATAGLSRAPDAVVRQPTYVSAVDSLIAATPVSTWRAYLAVALLDGYAHVLPSTFRAARHEFRDRALSGQEESAARWKGAVDVTNGAMGEALGRLYVERHFRPEAKARLETMVNHVRLAYATGIDSLEWMTPATKAAAKAKLARLLVKIGYPSEWRDYTALEIRRDDLLGNLMRSNEFNFAYMTSFLGKPVDRARWESMMPQTVNAEQAAALVAITFPAAILQPPFFDPDADDAVNYGAIGAVIGHEIGHSFDDRGRQSDSDGNLRDWWTAADAKAFEVRANALAAQYEAISPVEGLHINGKLTMGENIGDLSGLAQAYRAYKMSLGGKEAPVIGGFTGDQRFFLGYAQIWRMKFREEALRQQLLSNSHPPGAARAFVPLVNNDAFQKAWGVKPGDGMWLAPEKRVKIW